MMKIGILGGTFNPIHNGHIAMAETAYSELALDKVMFMPTGNPPHKQDILEAEHRCNMIKLAIRDKDYFELSDFELKREGVIYTAETLKLLCRQNPDVMYVFIMGADSFLNINEWYHPERICRYSHIAVCARDKVRERLLYMQRSCLKKLYQANVSILNFECVDVSSHNIRETVRVTKSTDSVADMINPYVAEYITREGLYI